MVRLAQIARLVKLAHFRKLSRSKMLTRIQEAEIIGNRAEIRPGLVFLFADCLEARRHASSHCTGLPAAIEIGAMDFNWSSSVSTLFQSSWSFFVSIGAEGSE